jgi:hypothetical protein
MPRLTGTCRGARILPLRARQVSPAAVATASAARHATSPAVTTRSAPDDVLAFPPERRQPGAAVTDGFPFLLLGFG